MVIKRTLVLGPAGFKKLDSAGQTIEGYGLHVKNLGISPGDIVELVHFSDDSRAILATVLEINDGFVTYQKYLA